MSSNGNVLIIDDNVGRARELDAIVTAAGYHTEVVTEPLNTHYSLSTGSEVDVILCELNLTGLSWKDAGQTLRDLDIHVPAIMLSDTAEVRSMMTALRLGASDFFVRPIDDTAALINSIKRCVRIRQLRRDLQQSHKKLEAANTELRATIKVLEQDQQAGRQVQLSMLPSTPLVLDNFVFSHVVIPSLYLSGDFTDYFTVGDRYVAFFMADVSGHGSSSAFATVMLKNLFARKRSDYTRRNDATITSPIAMLQRANQELLSLDVGKFATMVVGWLDMESNTLTYSVAGHLPLPVLVSAEGVRYLSGEGFAVGLMADADYHEHTIALPESFTLALFSDGILETLPPTDLLAKESYFLNVFAQAQTSPEDLVLRLGLDKVDAAPDDIAALFISRRG